MHLKPAVWRAQCRVCGSSMQDTQFITPQELILIWLLSSMFTKHHPSQYHTNGCQWVQNNSAHPSNVGLALLLYVGPWPIIFNYLWEGQEIMRATSPKASRTSPNAHFRSRQCAETNDMGNLFINVHPSNPELSSFHDGNCLLIASTVTPDSLRHMFLSVVASGRTRSSRKALYDCFTCTFHIAFHGIWAKQNLNLTYRFHVSWWNLEVSKSLAASLECIVCHFDQYGVNWMANLICLCELTIVIARLPSVFRMAKAV